MAIFWWWFWVGAALDAAYLTVRFGKDDKRSEDFGLWDFHWLDAMMGLLLGPFAIVLTLFALVIGLAGTINSKME